MAQVLCNKSGILFNCEFLPISLYSNEISHPFFSIPQKKLLLCAKDWAMGKYTIEQAYLLYLALLDSTDNIQWRSHAEVTEETPAIVAANMEALIKVIGGINLITHAAFKLPQFIITRDTRTLTNSHHWIKIWEENITDWMSSRKDPVAREEFRKKAEIRETALDRMIRKAYAANPAKVATLLAEWAALVGHFPKSMTSHPITNRQVSIEEYWQQIIKIAHNEDKLWHYPRSDIEELIEHCHEHIRNEGIRGHALFTLLNTALKNYDMYLGLANMEVTRTPRGSTKFTVLEDDQSKYAAAIKTLIAAAPSDEPKQDQYPSHFAYVKALMQWKIAKSTSSSSSSS